MPDDLLSFRDVSKRFRGVAAVDGISLGVPMGHVRALLGENGAGKSTLIKMLAGALRPDGGEIWMAGRRVDGKGALAALDLGIVSIHQEFNLVPQLSVAQNIFLGHPPTRGGWIDGRALRMRARGILDRLGSSIDVNRPVSRLDVAEQQTVEIAKALSRDLKVLVMDEPTAALNDAEVAKLFEIVRGLRRDGVCVLYVSHRLSEIFALADSVSVLKDGRHVGTKAIADVTRDSLVRMMIGRDLNGYYPPRAASLGEAVFSASALRVGDVLDIPRLDVRAGEIVGIAGLEGQGQRTLLQAICGASPADEGEVRIGGESVNLASPRTAIAAGIGFIPDDRKAEGLALARSCTENVALASLGRRRRGPIVDRARERGFVADMVAALQIRLADPSQAAGDLSGGNQQKLVLAKALGIDLRVLVMAEPTRGVDVGAKREIYQIMRDLAGRGIAILMSSSDLPEILGMSDRILVMAHGRIVAELAAQTASEETIMTAATADAAGSGR